LNAHVYNQIFCTDKILQQKQTPENCSIINTKI